MQDTYFLSFKGGIHLAANLISVWPWNCHRSSPSIAKHINFSNLNVKREH